MTDESVISDEIEDVLSSVYFHCFHDDTELYEVFEFPRHNQIGRLIENMSEHFNVLGYKGKNVVFTLTEKGQLLLTYMSI